MEQQKLILDYDGVTLERKLHFAQEGVRPEEEGKGQREADGKFRAGNKGGPGNPFNRRVSEMRKSMLEAVSQEDLQQITAAMVAKAKSGDVAAAKLVLQYVVGKPSAAPDPDRVDVEEWKLAKDSGLRPEEVVQAATDVPVKEALKGNEVLRDMFYVGQRDAMAGALHEKTGEIPFHRRPLEVGKILMEDDDAEWEECMQKGRTAVTKPVNSSISVVGGPGGQGAVMRR